MGYAIILFSELVVLYYLSKKLTSGLYNALYSLLPDRKWSVYLFSLIFAPGTFVHEMSHFLTALFLLVPVSNLEIIPEIHDDGVKMGSVSIGKTDPVRRFLIGVAPFVLGTGLILGGTYFAVQNPLILKSFYFLPFTYLLFATTNTMFASKKDLEGAMKLFIFILFIYFLILITGIKFPFLSLGLIFTPRVNEILMLSNYLLIIPLALDVLLIFFLRIYSKYT